MSARKIHLLGILLMIITFACRQPGSNHQNGTESEQGVWVINDFEDLSNLQNMQGTVALSTRFPSHGHSCLRLIDTTGNALYMETSDFPRDWSKFDFLKFDIYNPSDRLYFGTIQILDEKGTDEEAEFYGQSYTGEKLFLNKGWNHFIFILQHAVVEEGDRRLALDAIRKLRFSFGVSKNPLFIDNLRLVRGIEDPGTKSTINPQDCMVIIDNRDVFPSLAGPIDDIKVSDRVKQLRKEANTAVQELRQNIGVAELQGYQTYYQRIPLITADIGLGIRSRLVWFQNEEEEKKILEYVISSCRDASNDILDIIAARPTAYPTLAPENEVSQATFYVPPYPPFDKLSCGNGFYRDQSGNPVMVFSMLQVNKGPLMDYFAPFNHRLESYTVGGGSRYTIESSPVYKAFKNDPGTHRVGWDGWCGHLIKDRWSMGGKKEDVVICLESSHIRQAVKEYMKLHYREWTDNPNLLYNIMAYELQYVCFCDKSQEMFRDWLKSNYADVGSLNKIWQTTYRSFNEIQAPETKNARPVDATNRAEWYDWACFNNQRFTDYMKWIKDEMRKLDPETPICAGGTSSMLNSSNSVTGIDEEKIINEVDDVILNESGGSVIYSDLLLSLSNTKKVMVDPEMGSGTHGILLQFLHGKSDISKWWWAGAPSKEFPQMDQSSLPHSKEISLADIDEVLRLGLDVRRLSTEISEFTRPEPEVAILYSKSSIIQVPPGQVQSGRTPYLDALYSVWEGGRYLGTRIGFISESQIMKGKLEKIKLLIIPAVKYSRPEIVDAVNKYIAAGGVALVIPESFVFDQYARQANRIEDFGISINGVTLPPVLGKASKEQNYDQSFSQAILYGEVRRTITCGKDDIFSGSKAPASLQSDGLVQNINPGANKVLARFEDGKPALVLFRRGKGSMYYLAAPLKTSDYHQLLMLLAEQAELNRPVTAVAADGNLITGVEVRAVEHADDYLVYACNLTGDTAEFKLIGKDKIDDITDLRTLREHISPHIILKPFQETIFRLKK